MAFAPDIKGNPAVAVAATTPVVFAAD